MRMCYLPGQADHVVVEMDVMCVPKYNKHHSQFQRNKIKQTGFAQHLNNDIPTRNARFCCVSIYFYSIGTHHSGVF